MSLPTMLPAPPIVRALSRLHGHLSSDLATLRTARPVLYTHRAAPIARLAPLPRRLVPDAPHASCWMDSASILSVLAAMADGAPLILTRRGIAVALLVPILEV